MSIIWRKSYHKRSAAFHMVRLFANQSKILFLHNLLGALFWDYSGIRIHGIGGNCVLLGPILIPEWRNSALFGINRIAGNRACSFGNCRLSFGGKIAYRDFLGLISISVTSALFSEYHELCSFGNWYCILLAYSGIGIVGISQTIIVRSRATPGATLIPEWL